MRQSVAAASFRTVASVGALGLIILGAAPMAAAQASPNADPILAEAIAGSTAPLNFPAKPFRLTDQHGRTVSLASLRGKVVLLTFLDPVCTTDCPLIAQEFRVAGQLLGTASGKVELVAVVANPVYHQLADTQAFDRQEHLNQVPNWLYLTGSVPQLQQVWKDYGIFAEILPAGSMIGHPDVAYVIDQAGPRAQGTQHRSRSGNHRHQVVVRGPARRRRPAGAEAVMSRRGLALPTMLLAVAMLGAGCGSAARQTGALARPVPPPSLTTSLVTSTGTWAVAVMGGPAASHNNFWQLFVRPAGTGKWRLATPPGVASNGGLVIASRGTRDRWWPGFRPSQELASSPLATTHDNGTAWTPSLLECRTGRMSPMPLLPPAPAPACSRCSPTAAPSCPDQAERAGSSWPPAGPSPRPQQAASAGLGSLTAAAFSSSGVPLLAARCARPGSAGVFAYSDRTWHSGRAYAARLVRARRTSPCCGSPPPAAPPPRCWRRAPGLLPV